MQAEITYVDFFPLASKFKLHHGFASVSLADLRYTLVEHAHVYRSSSNINYNINYNAEK